MTDITASDQRMKTPEASPPPESNSVSNSYYLDRELEDGPLFRATLAQLENRTGALKVNVKRILKTASQSLEAKQQSLKADINFVDSLREMPSLDPLSTHYLDQAWKELLDQRERLSFSMQSLLISPLQKIYDLDIKTADIKRRQFEEESKEYYALLSKYLSLKSSSNTSASTSMDTAAATTTSTSATTHAKKREQRKSIELAAKHIAKQRHFDLVRFDYYNFLMDLNGGKKEQEVLFHLLTYQQREYDFYQSVAKDLARWKPGLDELALLMAQASSEQGVVNKERQEKRRLLELKCMHKDGNDGQPDAYEPRLSTSSREILRRQPLSPRSQMSFLDTETTGTSINSSSTCLSPDGRRTSMDPSTYSAHHAKEAADQHQYQQQQQLREDHLSRRKEGFLFSTAKSTKSNTGSVWHKHWAVVSGGQLYEYSNWKRQLETHNEPINLRFAAVREARNNDRRFCFEVITPQFSRVYQATSQDDMQSWMQSIGNAIENALNGGSPSVTDLTLDISSSNNSNSNNMTTLSAATDITPAISTSSVITTAQGDIEEDIISNSNKALLDRAASGSDGSRRKSWKDHGRSLTVALNGLRRKKHHGPVTATGTTSGSAHGNNTKVALSPRLRTSLDTTMNFYQVSILSLLRENPSNYFCGDCGVKNPDWCSLNLGVVICIDCSGIHRSMGTHITKIRSLTLDTTSFTADAVQMLENLGNEKTNRILEANLPEDGHRHKITPNDTSATKQAFIRDKYELHQFMKPSLDSEGAVSLLFQALDDDDIPEALRALILGADPNSQRPDLTSIASSTTSSSTLPPLFSEDNKTQQVLLPVLDVNGNLVHNRTTSIQIPLSKTNNSDDDDNDVRVKSHTAINTIRYALHVALLHPRKIDRLDRHDDDIDDHHLVFPMAELLLQNGARLDMVDKATGYEVSELLSFGATLSDQAITYINKKNQARGRSPIQRTAMPTSPSPPGISPSSASSS